MAHERDEGLRSLAMLAAAQTGRPIEYLELLTDEQLYELITLPKELEPLEPASPPVAEDRKIPPHRRGARASHWMY